MTTDTPGPQLGADRFYDAGDAGCAGPGLREIRDTLEALDEGQTMEIRTTSDVGRTDLEAFIRLRGHEMVAAGSGPDGDRWLVRRGPHEAGTSPPYGSKEN